MEEVGLKVKNIRYYKSQPWSLSSSLLMGFYCDLDGSDHITLEEDELSEAEWFEREDIPYDEYDVSLTREMMSSLRRAGLILAKWRNCYAVRYYHYRARARRNLFCL